MKRRNLMVAARALVTIPAIVVAQRPGPRPRIGLLWIEGGSDSIVLAAFRDGLRAHGYVEGQNVEVDTQSLGIGTIVFELAVNLKTAKSIYITMPSSILQRADKVID